MQLPRPVTNNGYSCLAFHCAPCIQGRWNKPGPPLCFFSWRIHNRLCISMHALDCQPTFTGIIAECPLLNPQLQADVHNSLDNKKSLDAWLDRIMSRRRQFEKCDPIHCYKCEPVLTFQRELIHRQLEQAEIAYSYKTNAYQRQRM